MSAVAVVGSGIAGLAAARRLAQAGHTVTVFEAAARAGGHTYTVEVDDPRDGKLAVDMGFIVCNAENYPCFMGLLAELGVPTRPTSMSFSVVQPADDLEWGSASLGAVFADRRRLLDRRHWRFLRDVLGFLRAAAADLADHQVADATLDEYLTSRRISADVRDRFIVPLAAALWSLAPERCGEFPAEAYLRFLDQHGMLHAVRPLAWRTVVGGSQRYLDALLATTPLDLRLASPVTALHRDATGVTVVTGGAAAGEHRFARVVIATHADTALALLAAPTDDERRVLGAFRYSQNRTVLHRDRRFLPRRPAAHASWNYVADPDTARVAVTYSMTRLQGLPDDPPYLVTLNPRTTIAPTDVLHEAWFTHPQFDRAALAAQRALPRLTGHRTYYAGAHFGFGFHEDGCRSGQAAAGHLIADEARR
jgi:predicted NAD/FAD-binding protein